MRRALCAAAALLIVGCGEEEPDLKQELQKRTADLRGKVYPLPQPGPFERAVYRAGKFPDPFFPKEKTRP